MACLNDNLLKYNCSAPRYTSYPTAANFSEMSANDYAVALKAIPNSETLSLYLHIPFCQQLCWYCGCHTKITKRYAPVENYFYLLLKELRIIAGTLEERRVVSNIHFGGGSPNMLRSKDFALLMQEIGKLFTIDKQAEISIEVDPRNTSSKQLETYKEYGVNRLSLGIQDFNQEVQEAINRVQGFDLVKDFVNQAREIGLENINFDLIYGLPKQNPDNIKANIDLVAKLNPSRIAIFGYAHLPQFKKHMRLIKEEDLPSDQERVEIFKIYKAGLEKLNYHLIGIDHFAKPDDELYTAVEQHQLYRNFQGYTTDSTPNLIGIGASAISQLPDLYCQNIVPVHLYEEQVTKGKLVTSRGTKITEQDKFHRDIINDLMCYLTVDIYQICAEYNTNPAQFEAAYTALIPLEQDGLITFKDGVIKVNKDYPQTARIVASLFDEYNDTNQNFSKVV